MPKLRFVQLSSAGSDMWAKHPKYLDKDVVFCTTSGSNSYVRRSTATHIASHRVQFLYRTVDPNSL